MVSTFREFLQRNTVATSKSLPLVHTTEAYYLRHIWRSNKIVTKMCDVFLNENLSYFFVGKPSYKKNNERRLAEFWELPACFIVEYESIPMAKRIFPFDSGALFRNRYPDYISMMPKNTFELEGDMALPEKIIGAFFGNARNYFDSQSKDKEKFKAEFSLGAFDDEILAYHKLTTEKSSERFDDRAAAIEIQTDVDVGLMPGTVLAVVAPVNYLDNKDFRDHVEYNWRAAPISYDIYSLNYESYMYAIYERVQNFYRNRGLL